MIHRVSIPFEMGLEDRPRVVELAAYYDPDASTISDIEIEVTEGSRVTASIPMTVPQLRALVSEWDDMIDLFHDAHEEAVLCGEVA